MKKLLIKEIFVYAAGNLFFVIANLLLTPFLTRNFSLSQYGAIELIYTSVLIVAICANLGLDSALLRFYYDQKQEKRALVTSTFALSFLSTALFCLCAILFFNVFKGFIFRTAEELRALLFGLLSVPFIACLKNQLILLRAQRKVLVFALLSACYITLTLVLTVLFVKYTSLGISSFFAATLISQVLVSLAGLIYLRQNFSWPLMSLGLKGKLLSYSMPLLIPALIGTFLASINKYFLSSFKDLSAVGIYAIGVKVSAILSLLGMSFRQAWIPYAFSIMDNAQAGQRYNRVFRLFIVIFFVLACLVTIFSRQIILLLSSESYLAARLIVGYFCLGVIFANLSGNFFNLGILMKKKTAYSSWAYLAGFLVNIILAFTLVPRYFIVGAALAALSGYFVTAMLLLIFSNRVYKIGYDLRLLFGLLGGYLVFLNVWSRF
ncbi:MAG: oligosaccharide flippase family protein [Candidatus Omnitrophica bacterium]|nr:oligosaccharide flippase family protein [Candidatus Omnitrophota bacterium]